MWTLSYERSYSSVLSLLLPAGAVKAAPEAALELIRSRTWSRPTLVSGWMVGEAPEPLRTATLQYALAQETNPILAGLGAAARRAAWQLGQASAATFPAVKPSVRMEALRVMRLLMAAGVLEPGAVQLGSRRLVLAPARSLRARIYFEGLWLDLFALFAAHRLVGGRDETAVAYRVKVASWQLGSFEVNLLGVLPDGRLLVVERNSRALSWSGRLRELVSLFRPLPSEAILLRRGGGAVHRRHWTVMGPRAFIQHLERLVGRSWKCTPAWHTALAGSGGAGT